MKLTELQEKLEYLKLTHLRDNIGEMSNEAVRRQMPALDFFASAVAAEAEAKRDRAVTRRVRQAHFPCIKTLDAYDWTHPKKINRDMVRHLFSLEFVRNKRNAVFLGPPGLGKTHLALALAHQACLNGCSVRFDTAINIINRLEAASQTGTFVAAMRAYTGPDLLCIDEIGFLPIDQRGADLLFQVISGRYETGSIILTSNRAFAKWAEIFNNDSTITSAILDRLLHHCDVVAIEGRSYRMKDRRQD